MTHAECNPDDLAFPVVFDGRPYSGLTKREYFAAMAMQGILSIYVDVDDVHDGKVSLWSTQLADALIAKLNEVRK